MTKHGCFQHESHDFSLDNYETEFVAGGMLSIIIVFNYENHSNYRQPKEYRAQRNICGAGY